MLEVQIFTLYPDLYPGLLNVGIYKKAHENNKWSLKGDRYSRLYKRQ